MLRQLVLLVSALFALLITAIGVLWLCLPLGKGQNPPSLSFNITPESLAFGGSSFFLGYYMGQVCALPLFDLEIKEGPVLVRSLGMTFTILGCTLVMGMVDLRFSNPREPDIWSGIIWALVCIPTFWVAAAVCFYLTRRTNSSMVAHEPLPLPSARRS
jgi:hypothetical protein